LEMGAAKIALEETEPAVATTGLRAAPDVPALVSFGALVRQQIESSAANSTGERYPCVQVAEETAARIAGETKPRKSTPLVLMGTRGDVKPEPRVVGKQVALEVPPSPGVLLGARDPIESPCAVDSEPVAPPFPHLEVEPGAAPESCARIAFVKHSHPADAGELQLHPRTGEMAATKDRLPVREGEVASAAATVHPEKDERPARVRRPKGRSDGLAGAAPPEQVATSGLSPLVDAPSSVPANLGRPTKAEEAGFDASDSGEAMTKARMGDIRTSSRLPKSAGAMAPRPSEDGAGMAEHVAHAIPQDSASPQLAVHREKKFPAKPSSGVGRTRQKPASEQGISAGSASSSAEPGENTAAAWAGSTANAAVAQPVSSSRNGVPHDPVSVAAPLQSEKGDGEPRCSHAADDPARSPASVPPAAGVESGTRAEEPPVHTAMELAGNHHGAEIENPRIPAPRVAPRSLFGEATSTGTMTGGLALHAATGMIRSESVPPVRAGAPPPAAGAAFERMDVAAAPRVLESTPHRLAVGVENTGLGWVEIRTSSTAGHVSATLASGTAESHHAIASQLPEVREFLAGEQVRVDNLGSERYFSSSGGRGGSTAEQGGGGGERGSGSPERDPPAALRSQESDGDGLSIISVRV
jgi:hypothetical protein